jgi:hypothetical protein
LILRRSQRRRREAEAMIDAFDWYTVLALGIASAIIAAVLFGTGFPSRKRPPR